MPNYERGLLITREQRGVHILEIFHHPSPFPVMISDLSLQGQHNNYPIFRVPSRTWKHGDLHFLSPGPEIALEFVPKCEKTWTKHEIVQKTWTKPGMLNLLVHFNIILQQFFFQDLCSCDFRMPLISAFWCHNVHTMTWILAFLTRTKLGDNLEFMAEKTGALHIVHPPPHKYDQQVVKYDNSRKVHNLSIQSCSRLDIRSLITCLMTLICNPIDFLSIFQCNQNKINLPDVVVVMELFHTT